MSVNLLPYRWPRQQHRALRAAAEWSIAWGVGLLIAWALRPLQAAQQEQAWASVQSQQQVQQWDERRRMHSAQEERREQEHRARRSERQEREAQWLAAGQSLWGRAHRAWGAASDAVQVLVWEDSAAGLGWVDLSADGPEPLWRQVVEWRRVGVVRGTGADGTALRRDGESGRWLLRWKPAVAEVDVR